MDLKSSIGIKENIVMAVYPCCGGGWLVFCLMEMSYSGPLIPILQYQMGTGGQDRSERV